VTSEIATNANAPNSADATASGRAPAAKPAVTFAAAPIVGPHVGGAGLLLRF
jgi:hypothetical protein